jgi:hypothetical protein
MAATNEKSQMKKHIANILRKELKYKRFVSVIIDYGGRSTLLWTFHDGIGGAEQKHNLNRVVRFVEEQADGAYTLMVTESFPEDGFEYSLFTPFYVLKALRDEKQFNRGIGGKSLNAIYRWCREKYAELSMREVSRDLDVLIRYGVIVLSLSGTYWFRQDFREKMDANGISFLPTYKV